MFGFMAQRHRLSLAVTESQHSSRVFVRVCEFVDMLEFQILIILNTNLTAKHVTDANNVLRIKFNEYQKNKNDAKSDLTQLCKAQLQFIDDVLYNDINAMLVTDPMYLSNRGKLAGRGYQFRIYQFDRSYETNYHFVESQFVDSKNATDGNYTMLPELKKSCNIFYKDIYDLSKEIKTEDENAPDFLIKQWAIERNLEEMFKPHPAPLPRQRIVTHEALPADHSLDESPNDLRGPIYFGCVSMGAIMGLVVGVLTAHNLNLTEDIIYNIDGEDVYKGYNLTTGGWCYTGGLMIGFTLFLGCMAEIYRSTKTMGEMMYDALVVVTPNSSTLSMFSSTWGMFVPEMHYESLTYNSRPID